MGLRGLFLLPPLDLPTHPYPAAAQLVTWMRLGGKEADGLDLNLAFFRWVVSSADRHAERAAAVLDGLPGEGGALGERLREAFACLEGLPSLDPWEAPPGSRLRAAWALLALAFAPWEGESPLWASHSIQYQGRADPHSSESILQALRTRSLFDLFYDDVLPSRGLDDYGYAGISVPFASQVEPALRLARSLKALRPGLRVFLGGPSASMQLAESRNASLLGFLDGIVVGPGERPMDAVARCLEEDGDLSKVPGLVHLVDGRIERVPLAKPVPLEEVPLPEPVFDRSAYLADGMVEPLRIRLSQGCTWARCAFCNITGHRHLFPLQRPDEEAVFRKVETLARRGERPSTSPTTRPTRRCSSASPAGSSPGRSGSSGRRTCGSPRR